MSRVRLSLQEVQDKYDTGEDKSLLENLIRAFRGIQAKKPEDENSFFNIAGFHGEPFRGEGATDPNWWGGYCHHGNVLFPTWHRALMLRLENALRSVDNCQHVTIPFWDECFEMGEPVGKPVEPETPEKPEKPVGKPVENPIPTVLTSPTFELDGKKIDNPLYSYKLQQALEDKLKGKDQRYSKPVGYQTVRYPLSGLVGNEKDREATKLHNNSYTDPKTNTAYLNGNVANWLHGTVKIQPDDENTRIPDTYSVLSRYSICMDAPSYTVFSNTTSQNEWINTHFGTPEDKPHWVVSLESPHNAIHLAVGGFYQEGEYNADPIRGANGDMGDNETASFDPIFYFHHCFIDYAFWTWQRKHKLTKPGSLTIDKDDPGAKLAEGMPDLDKDAPLGMDTPLHPFKKLDGKYYTSADLTDIETQLDYKYGTGSLDRFVDGAVPVPFVPGNSPAFPAAGKRVRGINRAQYPGSFVIRTYAKGPGGKPVEVGRDAILSRWSVQGCKNCQNKLDVQSLVPLDEALLESLRGPKKKDCDVEYWAEIQTHDASGRGVPYVGGKGPIVEDL